MSRLLKRVRACPLLAAQALTEELRRSRASRDTADLEYRTWLTQYVIDSGLVNAAVEVAQDSGATPQARVYAVRALIWQRSPGHSLSIREISDAPPDTLRVRFTVSSYTGHYYTDRGYGDGSYPWPMVARLPDLDYLAQTTAQLRTLRQTPGLPADVGNAVAYSLALPPDDQLITLLAALRKGR